MPYPYSMTYTPATGDTIEAAHITTSNTEHINNNIPESIDDYSVNEAEMQTVTDPYPAAATSLPTTLAGELERLRYVIKQITGNSQWYMDPKTSLSAAGKKNLLINGTFTVESRGNSFVAGANDDDSYTLDGWILLSDGNDIVDVTKQSDGGTDGNTNFIRLDVETVSKKFGIFQVIEHKDLLAVLGNTVSLSFDARVSDASKLSDIRAVVVAWDGTEDSVTSDIVSAWNAEGTRPTLVANWTAENTDSDLGVTTSWVRYTIENISIDTASAKNVGVFIYQNDVATNDTAGIFLDITKVQLEAGTGATDFHYLIRAFDRVQSFRYHRALRSAVGVATSTTAIQVYLTHEAMRAAPTVSLSAVAKISDDTTTYTQSSTNIAIVANSNNGGRYSLGNFTGLTVGDVVGIESDGGDILLNSSL